VDAGVEADTEVSPNLNKSEPMNLAELVYKKNDAKLLEIFLKQRSPVFDRYLGEIQNG
jgi:hypothetical protein